ncbi:hypothetical protein HanIR_Chr09g0410721 [Helianthus annuus]|nr:hypothetical protein HanIR_Chr09g0410721 [Helianthus annuus]
MRVSGPCRHRSSEFGSASIELETTKKALKDFFQRCSMVGATRYLYGCESAFKLSKQTR